MRVKYWNGHRKIEFFENEKKTLNGQIDFFRRYS